MPSNTGGTGVETAPTVVTTGAGLVMRWIVSRLSNMDAKDLMLFIIIGVGIRPWIGRYHHRLPSLHPLG